MQNQRRYRSVAGNLHRNTQHMAKNRITLDQALNLAKSYAAKGEVAQARRLYSGVLAKFPRNKKARKGLDTLGKNTVQEIQPRVPKPQMGHLMSLYSNGMLRDALREAKRLSHQFPNDPFLHSVLASCLVDSGQEDAAVRSYKRALQIKPDYVEVHNNLGGVFNALGQLDEAVASFERALKFSPDHVAAHYNLGNVLRKMGRLEAAARSYQRVLQIRPDQPEVYSNLGAVYRELGRMDAAVESYKQALKINPDFADAHNNLGNTFSDIGQQHAAISCFERALEIRPDFAKAYRNLGAVLLDLGQMDAAVESYKQALRIKPDHAGVHNNLSTLIKFKPDDTRIDLMESLLSNSETDEPDRMLLYFALAKAYDDTGKYNRSFDYLEKANRLRRKELNYDIADSHKLFSRIKETFTEHEELFENPLPYLHSAIQPVFIVGMPRSGTSLVEQILASHSMVFGAGELASMEKLLYPAFLGSPDQGEGQQINRNFFRTIRIGYLEELTALNVSENIITDKMPLNFIWVGFILSAFPAAKIVHLNRDAMATCWSIYKHYFSSDGNGYAYDMLDLAQFYGLYTDLMAFWHECFPGRIYDVRYESLTENQEDETRKLLAYCDLDWEDGCFDFHKTKRAVKTASASQVRRKMYKGSSDAWKNYEAHLQPLIKSLGFSVME